MLQLAEYAIAIEDHYSARAGEPRPMDIEWAKDGIDGELYIVQARPETVASQRKGTVLEEYRLEGTGRVLVTGRSVGKKIAAGPVRVIATEIMVNLGNPRARLQDQPGAQRRHGPRAHGVHHQRIDQRPPYGVGAPGAHRGSRLEIYVMCEIPNNVLQIDAFARLFDGFSIGSNDLTQLVLGVDRDSETVAFDFDERDPGVLEMIRLAVEGCRRNERHSGICGQAPSDYPEVAEALVRMGIDSISLNPDTVLKTTRCVLKVEKELGRAPREP